MKKRILVALAMAIAFCLSGPQARADVKPHGLFTDGMVLQGGMKCPIWGTADPGEKVHLLLEAKKSLSISVSSAGGQAGEDGKWKTTLSIPAEMVGGPHTLTIKGKNTITLKDVYVGEVWICSGQSNMEWAIRASHNADEVIKNSQNPKIRLFTVPKNTSDKPLDGFKGDPKWHECNPDTVKGFSAVGYFFGRDLQKALDVPVGLIHTSWGGSRAEAWTSRPVLESHEEWKNIFADFEKDKADYAKALETYKETAAKAKEEGKKAPQPPRRPREMDAPGALYNGMIAPLIPYAIKGAIWYQGESNAGKAYAYRKLFPTMIQNWRDDWKQGDFPFLFVQLAPYQPIVSEPQESAWAELREAQLLTSLHCKNTGIAVITDVGDPKDIHPKKKEPVGARLALAARGIAYGENVEYSGPIYDKMEVKDGKTVLHFKHVGKGLEAKDGPLHGFTIAGADRKFYNAQAEIQGDTVLVWCDKVAQPVAVRYGWANCPVVNLWNKDGLPASPFRTDDFPGVTTSKR
ncbi:MAG TPA: sialate O-acetylesterase [Gemmataceae bacterium]|jgi:sialate O-acetylesterase